MVCGDNWQEAKLMFDTFVKLFQVAIEMKKIGVSTVSRSANAGKQEENEADISIVHQTKPSVAKKVVRKANVFKVRPAGLPTDLRTKITEDRPTAEREALRRKKIALLRLRERPGRSVNPSPRRTAASFMGPGSSAHFNSGGNNMGMGGSLGGGPMQGMNMNMSSPSMQYNNMDMMMGYHGMNPMNMSGMNMGMCNPGNMMMTQGMFLNPLEQQGGGSTREERPGRSKFRGTTRGVRGVRRSVKGNVKERLGFKSTISVDPSLLNEENINEEEY